MFRKASYRGDIQVLRGLAVLAVVLFHATESLFPLGYLGVDVFFVISGFVVTPLILRIFTDQAYGEGRFSNLIHFYKRRFYRLAPALGVTLAISSIAILLLGPISNYPRFASQGITTLLLVGNAGAYRYSGDYFSPNPNPLVHTWSLSVEEQIYIFLPLLLMLILHNRRSLKNIPTVVLVFITTISFTLFLFPAILKPVYSLVGIQLSDLFSFYSPIERIWQFTLGGLGFTLLDRYQNRIWKILRIINLVAVFALVIILFGPISINLKNSSIFASVFTLFIIIFKSLDVLPNFLIQKLEWLGDRSYSIYLIHMPLLYLAKYSPVTQIGNGENLIVQSTIAVVASVLLGALSYSKIENRYRDRGKNYVKRFADTLKVSIFTFVVPLILMLTIIGFSGKNATILTKNRFDNGLCKFWTPTFDENIRSRFLKCNSKFGPAIVVLGDSHAMNIYNSLFLTTSADFFVGISTGGCRPNSLKNTCPYQDFKKHIELSPKSINEVMFHQSGSYLISDKRGRVDSSAAFRQRDSYQVMDSEIKFLINYLNDMGSIVRTSWIGPFPELRIDPSWFQIKTNRVKPNPIVKKAFLDLEKHIDFSLMEAKLNFRYVSLIKSLGSKQFEYKVGTCILFRDLDHWSTCGEAVFSKEIDKSLR